VTLSATNEAQKPDVRHKNTRLAGTPGAAKRPGQEKWRRDPKSNTHQALTTPRTPPGAVAGPRALGVSAKGEQMLQRELV